MPHNNRDLKVSSKCDQELLSNKCDLVPLGLALLNKDSRCDRVPLDNKVHPDKVPLPLASKVIRWVDCWVD